MNRKPLSTGADSPFSLMYTGADDKDLRLILARVTPRRALDVEGIAWGKLF